MIIFGFDWILKLKKSSILAAFKKFSGRAIRKRTSINVYCNSIDKTRSIHADILCFFHTWDLSRQPLYHYIIYSNQ